MQIDWLRPLRGGRNVPIETSRSVFSCRRACLIFNLKDPNFPNLKLAIPLSGDTQ
jgi:hypothetical protein